MAPKKKLTLSVDERIIEHAHRYSREHGTSISRLVSQFLARLGAPADAVSTPLVRRLRGVLPEDAAVDEYYRRMDEKHS